jgi:hypothetical protein
LKGSYSGVKASLESKFGISGQQIEKTHFLKISFLVSGDSYNLDKNSDQLKDLLDGGFKTALASWKEDRLFNEYGTHLIKNILVGGRAEYLLVGHDLDKRDRLQGCRQARLQTSRRQCRRVCFG